MTAGHVGTTFRFLRQTAGSGWGSPPSGHYLRLSLALGGDEAYGLDSFVPAEAALDALGLAFGLWLIGAPTLPGQEADRDAAARRFAWDCASRALGLPACAPARELSEPLVEIAKAGFSAGGEEALGCGVLEAGESLAKASAVMTGLARSIARGAPPPPAWPPGASAGASAGALRTAAQACGASAARAAQEASQSAQMAASAAEAEFGPEAARAAGMREAALQAAALVRCLRGEAPR